MGTSGNRDCQRASRSALKDFTDDALTISAGSLFQNGTARTASQLVELDCVAALSLVGWKDEGNAMGNSRRPLVILNMAIKSPRIRRCVRENKRSCMRAASCRTWRSPITNFKASFCTFSSASASWHRMGWVAWIAYSRCGRVKVLYRGRKILGVRAAKDRFK